MASKKREVTERETTFYYVKVPAALLERVEDKRGKLRHNKTAAVVTMMELYLKTPFIGERE